MIVGVRVTAEAPGSATFKKISLTTDQGGEFSSVLPEGRYILTFEARNFSVAKLPIDIAYDAPHGWESAGVTLKVAQCSLYPDPNRFAVSKLARRK